MQRRLKHSVHKPNIHKERWNTTQVHIHSLWPTQHWTTWLIGWRLQLGHIVLQKWSVTVLLSTTTPHVSHKMTLLSKSSLKSQPTWTQQWLNCLDTGFNSKNNQNHVRVCVFLVPKHLFLTVRTIKTMFIIPFYSLLIPIHSLSSFTSAWNTGKMPAFLSKPYPSVIKW